MISFADISSFDVIIVVILVAFAMRGVWIGFMRQLAAFLALVGSYWLAGRYSNQLMPYVDNFVENPKMVFLVSFGVLFCVSALLFILGGKVLRRVMEISLLGWFDRFLGLLLGIGKGVILASFLYMFLASSLSASNDLLKKSVTSRYLMQGAEALHRLIQDPEIQKYFSAKELAIPLVEKKEPDTKNIQSESKSRE